MIAPLQHWLMSRRRANFGWKVLAGGSSASATPPEGERAAVKLTPVEQAAYMAAEPNVFFLAKGDRGKKGWTIVELAEAKSETLRVAITQAWRNAATKQLLREYDGE